MSSRSLLCVTLAISAVAFGGCTADKKPSSRPAPAPAMALVAFDSCRQLQHDLRAATAAAVGPYGLPGQMRLEVGAVAVDGRRSTMDSAAVPESGALAAPSAASPAYSGTNSYEPGADEPDIVKTDGRRIVTLSSGVLRVVDAASRRVTGRLKLDTYGVDDLLLSGDRALLLASGAPEIARVPVAGLAPSFGSRLMLVDLSGSPRLISTYEGDGALVDARQTGTTARVVLRSAPRVKFPENPGATDDADRTAANKAAVAEAPVAAWLPSWAVTTNGATRRGTVGCGQVSRPSRYSGASMLTILTFDLGAPALGSGEPLSIVADGNTVYGTGTSLYVANDQRWIDMIGGGEALSRVKPSTDVYQFATPAGRTPLLVASGSVPGWLVNQYALSEWDGHLRVATTDDSAGASAVRVLERQGTRLAVVGQVGGLGKGERIYSVRFIGPRGYVVTFRQTDPLYSLDLSDPRHPKVTGQLKITGFSAHLQPVGENRLVGIGQEANMAGRIEGTQVTLFDVSDPAAPRALARHQVPGGFSEAEWDPHALLWWPATGLLVVPMAGYGAVPQGGAAPESWTSALALRVTGDGLALAGTIKQNAGDPIRRSLVVGPVLWTMSETGLQANDLSTLDRLAWLPNN